MEVYFMAEFETRFTSSKFNSVSHPKFTENVDAVSIQTGQNYVKVQFGKNGKFTSMCITLNKEAASELATALIKALGDYHV
jgi:hypothetical protein